MSASRLLLAPYVEQRARWPQTGRQVVAQYDDEAVVVYQAYRPSIGEYTAEHGRFGGGWSPTRMTWIKPNFLWMMYRSGWATKPGQETVLALWIRRGDFDALLAAAVPSAHDPRLHPGEDEWREAVRSSDVRLQWDPDHDPSGRPERRRALQLGLRGAALRQLADRSLLAVEDITAFVVSQRPNARAPYAGLITPVEAVYPVATPDVARTLGLDADPAGP